MFSLSATLKNGQLLTLDGDVTVEQVRGILPHSLQLTFNPTPCRAIQLDHNQNDQHYYIHRQLSEFPDFEEYRFLTTMDKKSKKSESASVPMPRFLVNNPNISILPATNINIQSPSTPPKQPPISTVHRISKVITPVTVLPVTYNRINNQVKSTVKNSFESTGVRTNCKRNALKPNCDRPKKVSRLSIATLPKSHKEKTELSKSPENPKLKHTKDDSIKKSDSSLVPSNLITVTSTPATSNTVNRVPQDSPNQQPIKQSSPSQQPLKQSPSQQSVKQSPNQQPSKQSPSQQPTKQSSSPSQQSSKQSLRQPTITDFNSKADSLSTSSTDVEENQNVVLREYQFLLGDFKSFNKPLIDARKTVKLVFGNESFEIGRPMIGNQILLKFKELMHEHLPTSELEFVKQNNSEIMNSSENKWMPESNEDVSSTNFKNSSNHNNTSTSKHQSPSQVNLKSHRITSYQAPSTSKQQQANTQISSSNLAKQPTSNNSTSKIQPPKQQDLKLHNISSNLHSTSLKHSMATVTHNPSVNKQLISDQHQPTSTKNSIVSSVTVQPVKPTIPCQSVHDVKKCSKCKEISEDDVCTTCRMSSQLKGVTVTRIEKPVAQSNVNEALSTTVDLISDDEESTEEVKRIQEEPVITRIESDEIIMKHLEKLNLSPTFLDESSWPKDTCTLPSCRTINIGSFSTLPVSSNGVLFSLNGIRLNVNNVDMQPVYIDVHMDNIVKILAYYGEPNPAIFIYTDYLAAVGIQHLLKMKETNKTCYFDPISKDDSQKKIVLYYDSSTYVTRPLETILLKLPKEKYAPLTNREFKIMMSHTEEPKRTPILKEDDIVIISEVDNRTVSPVKIFDYKMLRVDEFVNDVLIEFYLNYWYSRGLSEEDQKRSYVFSTFFYTSLTSKKKHNTRHDRVKSWTKNVNIFEKDFIFVPINESFHWYMAVICFPYLKGPVLMEDEITTVNLSGEDVIPNPCKPELPEKKFYCDINPDRDEVDGNMEDLRYFHPNYNDKNGEDYETDIKNLTVANSRPQIKQPCILLFDSLCGYENRARVIATLRDWLVEEYRAKNNGAHKDFSRTVFKGHVVKVPQQPNSSDCGLFVMHYFEKFFQHPIMDYTLPILHLENWFHIDEVTKDCQKRREVQNAIKTVMREQKAALPIGVELPEIIFRKDSSENSQNSSQYGSHNNQHFYDNDSDDIEHVEDESEDLDSEVDDEEYFEEDEDPEEYHNMEGRYNQYPDGYGDEYPELEEDPDPREYYGEMAEHEDWPEGQHDNDGEYHSESEYGAEDMNHYHRMQLDVNNVVVDVDGHEASSSNHRNDRNRLLNDGLRSFTNKSIVFRNNDENDSHEVEDDDNEGDDDDDDNSNNHNRSTNHHSSKHTRFHHHR